MSDYILIVIALAGVGINLILSLWLWYVSLRQEERFSHLFTATQRLAREISQQRYAMAVLRQLQNGGRGGASKEKTDKEMMDAAVTQLDEVIEAIEATQTEETAAETETAPGETPKSEKADNAVKVDGLKNNEILQFIKNALKNNHIAAAHQPVVTFPERQIRFYEIFARIMVPGQGYIPAHKFISVAKSNNLMAALDNLLLLRCLQLLKKVAEKEQNMDFFINISVQTLNNKEYINGLIEFLAANPKLSSRLIFEMTQEDSLHLSANVKGVIEGLALLGCRFSMDQITILGMDTARLVNQNIAFVKLDAKTIADEIGKTGGLARLRRIKHSLDTQGISVIIEKVENDKQLVNLFDMRVDYGQGFLFGQPTILE